MHQHESETLGQVRIRITGDRASVGSVAAAISDTITVTHMSQPYPNHDNTFICVYLTVSL